MVRIPAGGNVTICGGSLINSRWVLTSSSCAEAIKPFGDHALVILGDHEVSDTSEDHEGQMKISDIIEHPKTKKIQGRENIRQFNIALLKLKNDIDFTKYPHIRPVCLPKDTKEDYVGQKATVTGWGNYEQPPDQIEEGVWYSPSKLQYITGVVKSNLECSKMKMGCKGNPKCDVSGIPDDMLCVTHHRGKLCAGDFGGPLVTKSKGKTYEQIGVAAFTPKLCNRASYGGYTRVTAVLGWIKDSMGTSHTTCPRE